MSRGPGRWQRAILDAVDDEWTPLVKCCVDIPGESKATLTRPEVVARRRAAHTLAARGAIDVARRYLYRPGHRGTSALHVRRPATTEQRHVRAEQAAALERRLRPGAR